MRSEGYRSVRLAVSATQHLTSRTFVRLAMGTTNSTGNESQNFFVVFSEMLRCRARALPSLYGYALVGHFYSATYTRVRVTIDAHAQYTVSAIYFEKTPRVCELLLIMPPSKVCPQCQAVVYLPPRLKMCTTQNHIV